jgi:hypothetical protein
VCQTGNGVKLDIGISILRLSSQGQIVRLEDAASALCLYLYRVQGKKKQESTEPMKMRKTASQKVHRGLFIQRPQMLFTYAKRAVELDHTWLGRRQKVTLIPRELLYSVGVWIEMVQILGVVGRFRRHGRSDAHHQESKPNVHHHE